MQIDDILKKQIKIFYPNADVKSDIELIGLDIDNVGRLYVKKPIEIHIVFKGVLHNDDGLVNMFFAPRIKSELMRIYLSKTKFQAYRMNYGVKSVGNLETAMEYFRVFKSVYDSIIEFNSYK